MTEGKNVCELCDTNLTTKFIDNNGTTLYFCDDCLDLEKAQKIIAILGSDLEVGEYDPSAEEEPDNPIMHCILCNSEEISVDEDGILACDECGEDYPLDAQLGFFHYGQAGFEYFSHYSHRELSIMMAEETKARDPEAGPESWRELFVEQFHMGTGAIEVLPNEHDLLKLEEAVEWMKGEIERKKAAEEAN